VIRASAPGRCGIAGNPTDGYGGSVLSSSLAERAVVEITPAEETVIEVCGCRESLRGETPPLSGDYTDVAKAVLLHHREALRCRTFRLRAATTVPMQAGLAGSTAILVAILGAVRRLLGIDSTPYEIAETARRIEFDLLGVVCGFQDQYMAVFGGLNYLDFRDKEPDLGGGAVLASVEPLETYIGELPLILANTGVQRHSGSVHRGLRERWLEGEPAVREGYLRIARLAREAKVALLDRDWPALGKAMNENHAIQRDLGGSGEANERLIAAALAGGALGAKLAGAGRGGTIIALHEDPDALGRRLAEAGATRILRVRPSAGLLVEGSPE